MNSRNNPYDIDIHGPNRTHFQEVGVLSASEKVVAKLQLHAASRWAIV